MNTTLLRRLLATFTTFSTALLMTAGVAGLVAPGAAQAWGGIQGSGKSATESRQVSDFEAISINGSFRLEVRQGTKEAVTVTGDDNLLPLIETLVEQGSNGRTLIIRSKRGESYRTRTEMKITVDVVKLVAIGSSGSGDVLVEALKTPSFKLSISGSGDATMRSLETDSMQLTIAGSGDVRAAGNAKKLRISIAGSGDAAMADLVADDVSISIAGSGDASVTANKSLTASVAGSGDVRYRGAPTELKTSVAGSGTVRKQ